MTSSRSMGGCHWFSPIKPAEKGCWNGGRSWYFENPWNSSLVIIKFGWWIAHCYGYVYRMKGLKRCSRIALTAKKPVSDIIDITVAGMLQQPAPCYPPLWAVHWMAVKFKAHLGSFEKIMTGIKIGKIGGISKLVRRDRPVGCELHLGYPCFDRLQIWGLKNYHAKKWLKNDGFDLTFLKCLLFVANPAWARRFSTTNGNRQHCK